MIKMDSAYHFAEENTRRLMTSRKIRKFAEPYHQVDFIFYINLILYKVLGLG